MPRAGGVYSAPPGTAGTPNTTIESAKYNALVADLVADANAARPITAGGTGSGTAAGGNDNLNVYGADMASAATLNLANSTGSIINVTGTVTISALGTMGAGVERTLVFASSLTLVYNATSLILPTVASSPNLVVSPGDVATFRSKGGGNWVCTSFLRANGGLTKTSGQTIVQPTLTLAQSAAPTPTAEGDIQWDTDDDAIVVGDGVASRVFLPIPSGTAAGDTLYLSAAKVLARVPKGTALQGYRMNAGATAPEWATTDFGAGNAALALGAVGTYALLGTNPGATINPGAVVAGSGLRYTHTGGYVGAGTVSPSGSWKAMGLTGPSGGPEGTTLFLRVS